MVRLVDIVHFPAECVNPPPGVKSVDWIVPRRQVRLSGGFAEESEASG
jgi:hypothetical protein